MSGSPGAPTTPHTVAIVLNWNGAAHTLKCVEALSRSRPAPPQILVVDNGSTDDSVALLAAKCRDVEVVRAPTNLGYAGGNNLGIRVALARGARRILLLNNDVEVEPDCVQLLGKALDGDPGVGLTGPILVLPGNPPRIWAAGGELSHRENITRLRGNGQVLNGQFARDEDVDYLPGTALMVRREVFEKVGLLDDSFFCYMEDVEFGRRVIEAGFRCRLVVSALAKHDASASTGGGYTPARKYMNAVNSVRFLRLHPSLRGWFGFFLFDVLGLPAAFVNATLKGRPGAAWAKLVGIVDGLRGRPVTPASVQRFLSPGGPGTR